MQPNEGMTVCWDENLPTPTRLVDRKTLGQVNE